MIFLTVNFYQNNIFDFSNDFATQYQTLTRIIDLYYNGKFL